jgi:hypothetical protein
MTSDSALVLPVAVRIGPDTLTAAFLAGRNAWTLDAYRRDLEDFRAFLGVGTAAEAGRLLISATQGMPMPSPMPTAPCSSSAACRQRPSTGGLPPCGHSSALPTPLGLSHGVSRWGAWHPKRTGIPVDPEGMFIRRCSQ